MASRIADLVAALDRAGLSADAHEPDSPSVCVVSIDDPSGRALAGDEPIDVALLKALRLAGCEGQRTENHFWVITWTLAYWDVIFSIPVEIANDVVGGVLPNKTQDIPPDLFSRSREFCVRRQSLYEARRRELMGRGVAAAVADALRQRRHEVTRLMEAPKDFDWRSMPSSLAAVANDTLLAVLDRLWIDFATHRSGLPDLLITAPLGCLLEVKGNSDSARATQVEWARHIGGACNFLAAFAVVGWSDRKVRGLIRKLGGPAGTLAIEYGRSSSKFFDEVEEAIEAWDNVSRSGRGRDYRVTASLPLSRLANAVPVLDRIQRWKGATIRVDGAPTDWVAASPLRCLASREAAFAGSSHCAKPPWPGAPQPVSGCKRLDHKVLSTGEFNDYGFRDSERGVFVIDKARIARDVEEAATRLGVCPYFRPKKAQAAVEKLPDVVDPREMSGWAWRDNQGNVWIHDGGSWKNRWGGSRFPGVSTMVSVSQVTADQRREMRRAYVAEQRFRRELTRDEPMRVVVGHHPAADAPQPADRRRWFQRNCLVLLVGAVAFFVLVMLVIVVAAVL